ncbi:uncharacterized protein LOC127262087 [Andrographis paniculata]|uniref:uncharacterized protein LOC127262087 n=1 Tax=Andrographis paniculata TaxID=175694 RepID=UPI0021E802E8|nr:uncharacterized protein LOC127262087 [Andrographis paniculata]
MLTAMTLNWHSSATTTTGPPPWLLLPTGVEKRQLFLRSYQFSRKQSVGERIRRSIWRVKRVIWGKFRSARKLRKMLWLKLKTGVFFTRRRSSRGYAYFHVNGTASSRGPSSCTFW